MKGVFLFAIVFVVTSSIAWAGNSKQIEEGRYLVTLGGCNDCHTDGYLMSEGKVPESNWLKGSAFGWSGPWGTTYAPNLRLYMRDMTEDQWVKDARTLKRRPPMPWFNVNKMKEEDLRAIYAFVKSLGEPGDQAPAYLPPGKEPPMPFAKFPSPPPMAKH